MLLLPTQSIMAYSHHYPGIPWAHTVGSGGGRGGRFYHFEGAIKGHLIKTCSNRDKRLRLLLITIKEIDR